MYICVQKDPVIHLRFQRKYVYLIVFLKYFILVLFLFFLFWKEIAGTQCDSAELVSFCSLQYVLAPLTAAYCRYKSSWKKMVLKWR